MGDQTEKYHVFISHSSKDRQRAEILCKDLKKQGYKVWLDRHEIEGGEGWSKEIEYGIDNSRVMVVIWTENASKSDWVEREIARATRNGITVIPLPFDRTEINTIFFETTQYIDFRDGYYEPFPKLVSRLLSLIDESEVHFEGSSNLAWLPEKHPFYRSRFLEENNYRNRKHPEFGLNFFTKKLTTYDADQVERLVSFVAIPVPETIDFDFETMFDHTTPNSLASENAAENWQRFNLIDLQDKMTAQSDYVMYKRNLQNNTSRTFARFYEEGAIEYAQSAYYVHHYDHINAFLFHHIGIVGTAWKFVNFVTNVYKTQGYLGDFQLLVNLVNVEGCILDHFAQNSRGGGWASFLNSYTWDISESKQGIAIEKNLQFVYQVNVKQMAESPKLSEDLMVHLSKRLQRSFNFKEILERHYIPDTTEFPWWKLQEVTKI